MAEQLAQRHAEELRASGLSEETIARSGIYSAEGAEIAGLLGFDPGPGYVIPYPGTENGDETPFRRVKPDTPFAANGKAAKYLSPKKTNYPAGNRLYVPPNLGEGVVQDVTVRLLITEGEKKALKATQEGFPTIGLAGVTCWVSVDVDGTSRPIKDLDQIQWEGRSVVIVFDSDVVQKGEVRHEEYKLYRELRSRGAKCQVGRVPVPTGEESERHSLGGKLGLDDLLKVRGPDALRAVLRHARAPRKAEAPRSGDGKPRYHDIARAFLKEARLQEDGSLYLRRWRGSFWRWGGRAYVEWPDEDVEAKVMRYAQARPDLQERCTRYFVGNVVANLQGMCAVESSVQPPAWLEGGGRDPRRQIVLENGILDLEALLAESEDVIRPHTVALFSMNALPYGFDPEARCPLWTRTLERILPDETGRELLREWFGYCLLPEVWLQKFVVMVGEGANGKSVVCGTLARLLGEGNVSAVPIERFCETHNLVGTLGKLANIVSEFEEIDRASEGTLKSFVSGDPLEFNPKYKPTFTARPTARLVVATNNLPVLRDKSWGPYRRMVVLRFPVQIAEEEQDPHLVEKLEEELPGILNWALLGLFELLKRGRLVEPASSIALREDYRRSCNPARVFIEERLEALPTVHLRKQEVYDVYKRFCWDGGYVPLNEAHFAAEVYRFFGKTVRARRLRTDQERVQVYDGLAWSRGGGGDDCGPEDAVQGGQGDREELPTSGAHGEFTNGQGGQGGQGPPTRIPKE